MHFIWIGLIALVVEGCIPLAGLQVYEAVEARKAISAYDQRVAEGQAPARSLIWTCNQTAMTRRSPRNDGSWETDPAVLALCFRERGWEQVSAGTPEAPFGTWRAVGSQ